MLNFGVFIEVLPGKEGLLHVSEVSAHRIPKIDDAFQIGDKVLVTVKEIDDMHRVNLSRKMLIDKYDELEKDPEFAEQIPVEREREEKYALLPKGEDRPRRDHDRDDRPRRDRDDRPRRDFGGGEHSEHRPIRRFERERKGQ